MKNDRAYGYAPEQSGTIFAAKEAYRAIRTNLMFSLAKTDCKTILFTSSIQGEGKTTSSANIAVSIARSNKKVLLMDMDLRNSHIHRILKKSNSPGLTNYLSGFNSLEEVMHKDVYPGLDVICAGTVTPNPGELVGSEGTFALIEALKTKYDYIILDTPPVNVVSDALSLVPVTDGVVLVIRPKYTDRREVRRAMDQIEFVGGKVLGAIANGVQTQKRSYGRRYGNLYGYGESRGTLAGESAPKSQEE